MYFFFTQTDKHKANNFVASSLLFETAEQMKMGNPLYQSLKNGKIKVDLHPLNYPLFSPLVALYLLFPFRLFFFFIKKIIFF